MDGAGCRYWWLRSPGDSANRAADVYGDGGIDSGSYVDYNNYAVRPALYIAL